MKKVRFLLFAVIYLSFTGFLSSQDLKKLVSDADYTLYKEDFDEAFNKFEYLHLVFPDEKSFMYHYEIARHLSNGRGTSLDGLLAYEATKGAVDKFYNYWMGRVYFKRYEFDMAKKHFKAFLDLKAYKSSTIINETRSYMSWVDKAMKAYDDPDYYEVQLLDEGINSPFADISPSFHPETNELYFSSSRNFAGSDKEEIFEIFHNSELTGSSSPIETLGKFDLNSAKVEVVDNGKLFIYRENAGGDLYFSERQDGGWTKPKEFDSKIKKSLLESHFYIDDNQKHIFFASDKGTKGLDIYESFLDETTGEWSSPSPVSGEINGDFNEDSPFLSHDGQYLYFSSNRPEGIGGYDIYRSKYEPSTQKWAKPENLGFPVNTIDDEINFQLNKDNKTGYLSSNRLHGLGDYDIYYFEQIDKLWVKGLINDESLEQPMKNVTIKFHPERYKDESFTAKTNENGEYEVLVIAKDQFQVEILVDDQIVYTGDFQSITDDPKNPIIRDFAITPPVEPAKKVNYANLYQGEKKESTTTLDMLGNKFSEGQKVVINNIYFAFESAEEIVDNDHVIDHLYEIMVKHPGLVIEIGGHTDNVGKSEFNISLSKKRAQKIVGLLVAKGIESNRLVAVGYGESQPLASNDDENDGREINRRIEIKVLENQPNSYLSKTD